MLSFSGAPQARRFFLWKKLLSGYNIHMHKTRVGIIRGGPSNEYDLSLKTGANILKSLPLDKYTFRDILIGQDGTWHVHGVPTTPHEALTHVDVVFNALHGHYGEDGKIQQIFETHGIPFTGSGSFASAIGMNKKLSKELFIKEKIKTPQSLPIESLVDLSKDIHRIRQAFPLPIVIKPIKFGSPVETLIVDKVEDLEEAIRKTFEYSDGVMAEEFISGKEISCGVLKHFRDQELYTFPIMDESIEFNQKKNIEALAVEIHKLLGLGHYSVSDFIIHPRRGIFILQANTLPELTPNAFLPKSLEAVGTKFPHFLDHLIQLALSGK